MTRVDKILALCADGVRSPVQTAAAEMERTGKRAVGCMLEFCSEEIVYAANMLPVGLWGADIELREVKRYFPAFSAPRSSRVWSLRCKALLMAYYLL